MELDPRSKRLYRRHGRLHLYHFRSAETAWGPVWAWHMLWLRLHDWREDVWASRWEAEAKDREN